MIYFMKEPLWLVGYRIFISVLKFGRANEKQHPLHFELFLTWHMLRVSVRMKMFGLRL